MYRLQNMSACPPPACDLRVLQCDDDELGTAIRPCLEAAIGGSTTLVGAMMRYHTIMARINKEAASQASGSARLPARRPGRRHRRGAVGGHRYHLRSLDACDPENFYTDSTKLSRIRLRNTNMIKAAWPPEMAHNKGVEDGKVMAIVLIVRRDIKVCSCVIACLSATQNIGF